MRRRAHGFTHIEPLAWSLASLCPAGCTGFTRLGSAQTSLAGAPKQKAVSRSSGPLAKMSGVVRGPAGNNDCRIYVGNLPPDIRTKDVEDVFYKYGAIRDIDLKNRRGGPPFAFIEFEDPR